MKRLTIYLRSGLSLEYEIREDKDDVYEENGFLQVFGWKMKYQTMETDEGPIRSVLSEKKVKALVSLDQVEFYELEL